MAFVVAALEVSDKIQTVGAFAGFAAILGLAVLSVLYFGQAREVKRLREWAGRAPERAAEMQDRVATDAQRRVVAQPVSQARPAATQPATPGAAAAAGAKTAAAPLPGAATPPPVGAPTVAGRTPPVPGEATEVKAPGPDGTDQPTVLQPSVAGGAAGAAGAAAGAASGNAPAPATAAGATSPVPPSGTPGAAAGPAGSPAAGSPPAAGAPASGAPTTAAPATGAPATGAPAGSPLPSTGGGAAGPPTATSPATKPPAPAPRPEPAVPLRATRSARETAAASEPAPSTSASGATIAIVAAVGAIVVAIVLVVTGVIGGSDEPSPRNELVPTAPEPGTATTGTTGGGTTATLNRTNVSVVVLNGTPTANLAREAANKLGDDGYRLAAAGNRGDATVAKTVVLYAPGQERAARDIVRLLKLGTTAPLDAGTEVVAQGHVKPAGAKPEIVVTLGADAAQT
ncbi:MAG TPA: LytR C-terminal domain-containing protein [Solirubrobacteraceae bacterium]